MRGGPRTLVPARRAQRSGFGGIEAALEEIDVAGSDHVAGAPSVFIVFAEKLRDPILEPGDPAGRVRDGEIFQPDQFVISGVVALVKFVPTAKFAPKRVP